jgi:hypothetical protein
MLEGGPPVEIKQLNDLAELPSFFDNPRNSFKGTWLDQAPGLSRVIARTLHKRHGRTPAFPGNSGSSSASRIPDVHLLSMLRALERLRSRLGARPSNPICPGAPCSKVLSAIARNRGTFREGFDGTSVRHDR